MTNREKILFKILILLCIILFFFFTFKNSFSVIKESRESINKYENMIMQIKKNNYINHTDNITITSELSEITEDINTITNSELTDLILEGLKKEGIIPQKYQLSTSKKGDYLEVTITCSGKQITNYLCSIESNIQPFMISNINIKNNPDNITISIRYIFQKTKIKKNNYKISAAILSKLLRPIPKKNITSIPIKETKEPEIEEKKEIIENGNTIYKIIGHITENDGISYLYLKNNNTSRVYKIHPNDILENDSDKYIVILNEKKVRIDK